MTVLPSELICGGVALGVYAMAGHALEMVRATLTGLDRPVSTDATPVVFRVEPGQSLLTTAAE